MTLQFKTVDDLKTIIADLEGLILTRPTLRLSHPTLYRIRDTAEHDIILQGVRVKDWFFSADKKWVLPHDQMGLSFSSSFNALSKVYKGKKKHNPGKQVNVYWVLEQADLPPGMAFVQDRDNKREGHYFLTVTERIPLFKLVQKLKALARRMSVMTDAGKAL